MPDPQDAIDALIKPPVNPNLGPSQAFVQGAGDVLGINDAIKALRGGMTEDEAQNFAGNAALGAIPFGKGLAATKAIFAGPLALTANKQMLAKAMDMASSRLEGRAGALKSWPEAIRSETRWLRDTDGHWKFEIPDTHMRIKPEIKSYGIDRNSWGPLGEMVEHPQLYDAYPDLTKIPTKIGYETFNTGYAKSQKDLKTGLRKILELSVKGPDDLSRSGTAVHELEHAVQGAEGHAPGANYNALVGLARSTPGINDLPKSKLDQLSAQLFNTYQRAQGEVAARNAQRRFLLPPDELRAIHPHQTMDYPSDMHLYKKSWQEHQDQEILDYINALQGQK